MDALKYICVLVVFIGGGDTGGHGGSHHDHVKLHVPEFIHHDHHTKVITIHHHHHKPKENHHHHHHHHVHKPHIPFEHHYQTHHKKSHTKTQTSTSSHGQGHKTHRGKHGHHKHYGHRGHHGVKHLSHSGKHHDTPSFSYDPSPVSFDDDYKSYAPPVQPIVPQTPQIHGNPNHVSFEDEYKPFAPVVPANIPQTPQVYGVQHTVKQVKVFDSLPGALPGNAGSHGYEVTEEGEQSDDDAFTAINSLSQTYPATFGYVRNAGIDPAQNEILADFPVQSSLQTGHDPFASAPQQPSFGNIGTFSSGQADPFSSAVPSHDISPSVSSSHFPINSEPTGFDDPANMYSGDITGPALVSPDDALSEDTPVSFSREAGIQETFNTGDVETIVY